MINYRQLHYFRMAAKAGGITRAAEQLHLTPQTLSGQISQLEDTLGVALFKRIGRRMVLTEQGKEVLSYADEIFQVGQELEQRMRDRQEQRQSLFRVGIADVLPKTIAYLLLAPALQLPEPTRLICREDKFEQLLAALAIHRLDVVLSDRPIPPGIDVKGFSHRLGESRLHFMATPAVAGRLHGPFPKCLDRAPLLIPGVDSAVRNPLLRWLATQDINPTIVGEFDDGALMKAFGRAGVGVFPVPQVLVEDVAAQYGVIDIGHTDSLTEKFYVITSDRKLSHPAARQVSEAAQKAMAVKL